LGDSREALRLFRELLPDRERVLGHDHPDTLDTLEWLGVATIQTGNRAEGCQLLREGRARAARRYGDHYPLSRRFQDAINEHQCEGSGGFAGSGPVSGFRDAPCGNIGP